MQAIAYIIGKILKPNETQHKLDKLNTPVDWTAEKVKEFGIFYQNFLKFRDLVLT